MELEQHLSCKASSCSPRSCCELGGGKQAGACSVGLERCPSAPGQLTASLLLSFRTSILKRFERTKKAKTLVRLKLTDFILETDSPPPLNIQRLYWPVVLSLFLFLFFFLSFQKLMQNCKIRSKLYTCFGGQRGDLTCFTFLKCCLSSVAIFLLHPFLLQCACYWVDGQYCISSVRHL